MATSVYLGGSGGGGTPASPANSIQFNNAGAFGGNANLEYVTTALTTPSAPVVTQHGAAGATTYGYEVAWKNIIGITAASAETTTATGNATLTGSNYNIINPGTAPAGATAYYVWRTTAGGTPSTTGFIGQGTIGVPFNDTGIYATLDPTTTNTTTGTYDNGVIRLPSGGSLNGNDRPALWIGADEGDFSTSAAGAFAKPGLVTMATVGSYDNLFQTLLVVAEGNVDNADPFAMNVSVDCTGAGSMTAMKVFMSTAGTETTTNDFTGITITPLRGNPNSTVTDSIGIQIRDMGDITAVGAPTPTRQVGYLVVDMQAATNNYGIYSEMPAASNKWFIYGNGTAKAHFGGVVETGTVQSLGELDLTSASGASGNTPGSPLVITAGDGAGSGLGGSVNITSGGSGSGTPGDIVLTSSDFIKMTGPTLFPGNGSIATGQTNGNSLILRAYDVDGATYKTFLTLTSANTPDMTIGPAAGATVTLQASTYKSSDGSTGATAGPFTTISSITVKNGLVTALTGS